MKERINKIVKNISKLLSDIFINIIDVKAIRFLLKPIITISIIVLIVVLIVHLAINVITYLGLEELAIFLIAIFSIGYSIYMGLKSSGEDEKDPFEYINKENLKE
jgi:hypothetical protein